MCFSLSDALILSLMEGKTLLGVTNFSSVIPSVYTASSCSSSLTLVPDA